MSELNCVLSSIETLEPDVDFISGFESNVKNTISNYNMFSKDDKILVAVSGGKDSTVVLHLLKKFGYCVEAVTVDAHIGCYTEENLKNIRKFCSSLDVKLHEISFRKAFGASLCYIRDTLNNSGFNFKSCTVCGVLRRYLLNKKARELKADKIVFGHNLDDGAQGFFMNLLKNRLELSARMGPVTGVKKEIGFVTRVKPLFFTSEADVIKYSKMHCFPVKYGKCPCSVEGFRNFVKDLLNNYEKSNVDVKRNIVDYFMLRINDLKSSLMSSSRKVCVFCEEPSSGDICRSCRLIMDFKMVVQEGGKDLVSLDASTVQIVRQEQVY